MKDTILYFNNDKQRQTAIQLPLNLLSQEVEVLHSDSIAKTEDFLAQHNIPLIVINKVPDSIDEIIFLKEFSLRGKKSEIIFIVDPTEKDLALNALENRWIDLFLLNSAAPLVLARAIDRRMKHIQLQSQLREALTEVSYLDDAKKHFMFLINHELKTPLTAITSFLSLLTETKLDDDQKTYTKHINKNTQRLNKLIMDILELVSAKTNQIAINKQQKPTKEVFSHILQATNDKAKLKNLDFVIEEDAENLQVSTDSKVLENILQRLTDNAIKHSPKNSKIKIAAKRSYNNSVEISIENTSSDIDNKTLKQIIEPFVLNENVLNHSNGLGLGLSISQALLKCMNSKLILSSTDKNFCVKFTLPSAGI